MLKIEFARSSAMEISTLQFSKTIRWNFVWVCVNRNGSSVPCHVTQTNTFSTVLSFQCHRSTDARTKIVDSIREAGRRIDLLLLNNICVVLFEIPCTPRLPSTASVGLVRWPTLLRVASISRPASPRHDDGGCPTGQHECTWGWGTELYLEGHRCGERGVNHAHMWGGKNSVFLIGLCLYPLGYQATERQAWGVST